MTALDAGGVRRALVALFLTLGGAALVAASDPGVTARAILGRDRYQTDFPAAALSPTDGASAEVPVRADPLRRTASLPVPALPTVQVVLIVAFVVIGLALLFRALPGAAPTEAALPAPAPVRDKKTKRPPSVEEADALAGQGRFAEAIHALLLNALSEMAGRVRSAATSPAATSREILDSPTLSSAIRAALHPIVIAVESVHFGRGTAAREDYTACLAHYQRLQAACRAGA
jgi:hypothetical protein